MTFKSSNIIQLLTIEALDMIRCQPESTNIDGGSASINIGIVRSTSHHVNASVVNTYFII